ncbi:MAG TPA: flagellar biosynthesis protein FlgL [Sulfurimonas autotrophica]|nr:flagellar biosynthesis protein FlgL [Sulfurimonas autotrophica]
MRVTSSMYYNSLYATNNLKLNNELFDVNKQIASGLKIQYAKDDVRAFTETMRLDNELVTITQVKKSTQSGYKISNQTDIVLNEFETSLDRMKTLLLNAANGTHSSESLDAIAGELRGLEKHFKNLANTSINGQFLFSGSAINTRPIDEKGVYQGNDEKMESFLGSNVAQKYNLTGAELFLGENRFARRSVTTNVIQENLSEKFPGFSVANIENGSVKTITKEDTIRDLMGDTDGIVDTTTPKHHFYIRGVRSDGSAFTKQIDMKDDDKIDYLLTEIGKAYGNTANLKLVNVGLNSNGQITIEDKIPGSSKLDFHMVGAVDFDQSDGSDEADINDAVYGVNAGQISNLDGGETNFFEIINPTTPPANDLYVKEFTKSPYASSTPDISNIDGLLYDRTNFTKDGSGLTSNVPQVLKAYNTSTLPYVELQKNAFATPATKLSDVADAQKEVLPSTIPKTYTLDGTAFKLVGSTISGVSMDVDINLNSTANGGSTFTDNTTGQSYNIFDMTSTPRAAVDADDMTYQQLMDVINMAITGTYPATNTETDYDKAVANSKVVGDTFLTYDGKIKFDDAISPDTKAVLSLYDSNSGDFSVTSAPVVMSFNANNALTVVDPKTDFFKNLDEAITAVEDYKFHPDSSSGTQRNIGIENALAVIDKLQSHLSRNHSVVGAQSNTLSTSLERTSLLEVSTMTLRSEVIDTDLAEASLRLSQLSLNYQAMLSTVGKISQLSLVNYL